MKYPVLLFKIALTGTCVIVGMLLAMSFESSIFWINHSGWFIIPVLALKVAGLALAFVVPQLIWKSKIPQPQA